MNEITVDEYLTDILVTEHCRTLVVTTKSETGFGFEAMGYIDPGLVIAKVYCRTILESGGDWPESWCAAVHAVQPTGHLRNWAEQHDSLTTAKHALERMIDTAYRWMGEAVAEGVTT